MLTPEEGDKLWQKIGDIKTAMLTTRGGDEYGHSFMHARPMSIVQDEFDGALWFFTDERSEKVDEIEQHPQVCCTFCDEETQTYVSLTGYATINNNPKKIDAYWNAFVSAYFPKGKHDSATSLMRVAVYKAEIWDADTSQMKQLFQIAKANLLHEYPDLGDHLRLG